MTEIETGVGGSGGRTGWDPPSSLDDRLRLDVGLGAGATTTADPPSGPPSPPALAFSCAAAAAAFLPDLGRIVWPSSSLSRRKSA